MIFDSDDLHEHNHRLDLLVQLKEANPAFKMTAFAIPGLCSERFLSSLPDWIELAVHGWMHPHPHEASTWSRSLTEEIMNLPIVSEYFTPGFKAPGWQISDDTYEALADAGWWVADQPYNDHRRPLGLLTHRLGDGDHLHTHIQDTQGNGLSEMWPEILGRVTEATEFQYISEVVQPWRSA